MIFLESALPLRFPQFPSLPLLLSCHFPSPRFIFPSTYPIPPTPSSSSPLPPPSLFLLLPPSPPALQSPSFTQFPALLTFSLPLFPFPFHASSSSHPLSCRHHQISDELSSFCVVVKLSHPM